MLLCGVLLTVLGLYHWRVLPTGGAEASQHSSFSETMRETWGVIAQFFQKKYIWIYIAWIVFYRFTEGLVIKIVPLFLKADTAMQGLGLTKDEIGLYYGTFGVVAFILGSILGGYFISWRGLKKAIFPLCCIFNTWALRSASTSKSYSWAVPPAPKSAQRWKMQPNIAPAARKSWIVRILKLPSVPPQPPPKAGMWC